MKAVRTRRLLAASAIGVLMAGGAVVGTAGTASAATPASTLTNHGRCFDRWGFGGYCDRGDFFRPGVLNTGVVVIVLG
ncbi:hypothetical protein GCM10010503_54510 [Streptomyces lucensis JCM 4490]|uniref:Chitinase n=1 Tax=Streptomyces lucensis JCM 4490 TaxID=1306176 RepID=A0A918MUV9_9ACTN|nr:hypothetical protein [Streptomyces lucensis]GGW70391.1 hypothetical protein GCM10010503_54510 [Streptomyces lucensis JCM 4490]